MTNNASNKISKRCQTMETHYQDMTDNGSNKWLKDDKQTITQMIKQWQTMYKKAKCPLPNGHSKKADFIVGL